MIETEDFNADTEDIYNISVDVDLSEVLEKMDTMQESIDGMKETIETMQGSEVVYTETMSADIGSINNNVFLVAVLVAALGGVACGLLLSLHFKR